ncbi:putative ribonuclease H-like domain-containing protein [Tanacetum coccineum]
MDELVCTILKSFASLVTNEAASSKVNFRSLDSDKPINAKAKVKIPKASILDFHSRYGFSLYGYFVGKRVAFPVVENYVKNAWKKFGLIRVMMNSNGFFFFKFTTIEVMNRVLENGPWFIRSAPIILKKWMPNANLLKEDKKSVPIWVKFHDILIVAFTADGLIVMATKLADRELKEDMVTTIPNVEDDREINVGWETCVCAYGKLLEIKVTSEASTSKPSTSMGNQLVESDEDEVKFPDDETSRYLSSIGGV